MKVFNSFSRLTVFGKILVVLGLVSLLCFGYYAYSDFDNEKMKSVAKNIVPESIFSNSNDDYDAVLLLDTYTGWTPIVWGNGGNEPNENSPFYKKFGVKLKIMKIEFDEATAYWKDHENSLRFCTLDSYPVEASQTGTMTDGRYFMIHNFSCGADAIVATKNIKKVEDLKGKKIACSEGTASHSLLLNTLSTSGLTNSDVKIVMTGYGSDVALAFKAGVMDAAVVFCPDDDACLNSVPGCHILTSTKQCNTLVTDGLIAHSGWLEKNKEKAAKITEALLWANSEFTNNKDVYQEACELFSEEFDVKPVSDVLNVAQKINFATLEDNINWFGLNTDYDGVTGENLYTKMSHVYGTINLTKSTLPWRKISDISVVEYLADNNCLDNDQSANGTKPRQFKDATNEVKKAEPISNKKVVIEFPVDGYKLDADAEALIEREFSPIVKTFNNAYFRIDGNTDDTGSYAHNVELSLKRAESVKNYLIRLGFNSNQLVANGNGPEHARRDGVKGSNQAYRTTDLQIVEVKE